MEGGQEATTSGPSPEKELWKEFGRDNPAGKALFKLYNKDAAKHVGASYNTKNKQVDVPKFPKRISYDTARVNFIPRRRPLEAIQQEIDAEYERMRAAPQAPPNRKLSVSMFFGRLRDAAYFLFHLFSPGARSRGYAPIRQANEDFYMRRMYGRIVVDVPKFPKRISYDTARVNFIPRRRPLEAIQQEIDAEYERMRAAPQAPPNRPMLDDREKGRLAELMRFRGKVPTVTPEQLASQMKSAPRKSERQQLEEMFEAIVGEIDERRQFLRDLEAGGRLRAETVHAVRAEIQQRVTELQRVDVLLQQCG
ncbi:hypothetical protein TSOC_010091 [Tetrabaena socialis]|uniref:Uncharacterized protein n=1 Tax=Tetrabaena socialis TaxID=47790 RepID=A0A2J7ZU77_9CHLO|nr:hypothetical protein TSOC_010091 [Tetrabaena socialis]|eukprot:PNH03822.1 hypothetical protein TSOC_010091 [Tetrabaena socialis]